MLFILLGVHGEIYAHNAVAVLRCLGVPGRRWWSPSHRRRVCPCRCFRASHTHWYWWQILVLNHFIHLFFFPFASHLFLPEEQSVRWTDCSVWHQDAGYPCQTALLPGESANEKLSNTSSGVLLLREIYRMSLVIFFSFQQISKGPKPAMIFW